MGLINRLLGIASIKSVPRHDLMRSLQDALASASITNNNKSCGLQIWCAVVMEKQGEGETEEKEKEKKRARKERKRGEEGIGRRLRSTTRLTPTISVFHPKM